MLFNANCHHFSYPLTWVFERGYGTKKFSHWILPMFGTAAALLVALGYRDLVALRNNGA